MRNNENKIIFTAPDNTYLKGIPSLQNVFSCCLLVTEHGMFEKGLYGLVYLGGEGRVKFEPVYDDISYIGDNLFRLYKDGVYTLYDFATTNSFETKDKPIYAEDGFIVYNNTSELTSRVAYNPHKRPAIYLNGNPIEFTDAHPKFFRERTMVPLRSVLEQAGATVLWDDIKKKITVEKDGVKIKMKIDDPKMFIGDYKEHYGDNIYWSDVAPMAENGRTYIPLRAFSEALGIDVIWDGETNSVYLEN